ncbi:MAG TPA: WD40 repeat domain-containing protein [Planctomycetota bacterium]|nr:WD40 repeat domain-containing protein [Planctomycetota bacterium]
MTRRRRVVLIAFLVLLAAELVGAGFAGCAAWRTRRPWRTLVVPSGSGPGSWDRVTRVLEGPEVRFFGPDRILVAVGRTRAGTFDYEAEIREVDSGKLVTTMTRFPQAVDPLAKGVLVDEVWPSAYEFIDPLSDLRFSTSLPSSRVSALAPGGEVVAIVASQDSVELRSAHEGTLIERLALPPPTELSGVFSFTEKLHFSPTGDRLAYTSATFNVRVYDLAKKEWHAVGVAETIGFTRSGIVVTPWSGNDFVAPVLLTNGGTRRVPLIEEEGGGAPYALSGWGNRFAFHREAKGKAGAEVVVETTETREVLRRVPVRSASAVRCVALSPEGERLAVAYQDGTVEIWEVP